MPAVEHSREGAERWVLHTGQHTCPIRSNSIVDTIGGFRGWIGAISSLGCQYMREQKHCSSTGDGSQYPT